MISSYPSIYAVGHRYIADLFKGPIVIEEKIDGSQFSFGWIDGRLQCRSKGQEINIDSPEQMFTQAVETAKRIVPRFGWIYRCEYLQKPKHNCLAYSRIPANHLILFDVMIGPEIYLSPEEKKTEAARIGIECIPCYFHGTIIIDDAELQNFFPLDSVLGGCKIEGVVVKNYNQFGIDKKILIGKFVRAAFKETHKTKWRKSNPIKTDVVEHLINQLKTEARWRKAIQHLREAGKITDTPIDIGSLLAEIKSDVEREEAGAIKEVLFKHFWPSIARGIAAGFPEWYKKELGILTQ